MQRSRTKHTVLALAAFTVFTTTAAFAQEEKAATNPRLELYGFIMMDMGYQVGGWKP